MLHTSPSALADAAPGANVVAHRTTRIGALDIFYREAGPKDAPVVVLLHGFPTSSFMFRDLIARLADRFRVIAPDYPGFGFSSAPAPEAFGYTFDAFADVIDALLEGLGLQRYALYMQDYGGPVGFRLALRHPERISGLIVQNAVVNLEGFQPDAAALFGPYWQSRNDQTEGAMRRLIAPETTRFQYEHGAADRADRVSPDAWHHDQALLDRPGNDAIQLELFHRYQENVAAYPAWQTYLATRRPPTLVVWGDNDPFFTPAGRDIFKTLVPEAQVHAYDAGHFALETHGAEIAEAIRRFLARLA